MMSMTLEEARKYEEESTPLGAFGDKLTKEDVKDLESLKNFIGMCQTPPFGFGPAPYIKDNKVFYSLYE